MPIMITDDDVVRLLLMPEAIDAMRVAFKDLAEGRAANPPRLRYDIESPDPSRRYYANIHGGAVQSFQAACVRAGSHFILSGDRSDQRRTLDNPEPVNWSVLILYDLRNGEPLAFMHETHLSGFRVGATTGLAVSELARNDAKVLGLYGTGNQAVPNCKAICTVRPIERVQVYSPSLTHREAFLKRMEGEKVEIVLLDHPEAVVDGADIVCCATNAKTPVLKGAWLSPGQTVVTIVNSDVLDRRSEVDEDTFARSSDIVINDWDSVEANRQLELLEPMEKGLVQREHVHLLSDIVAGKKLVRQTSDNILYYKNNTGLAIQFAACGAILHRKLLAEGTNRTIPRDWFASKKYSLAPSP